MGEVITRRPLADHEMARVLADIASAEGVGYVAVAAIKGVFNALLADQGKTWDDFSENNPLRPTAYQIPERQAHAILGAMGERATELAPGTDASVHVMLTWVDVGPSSYREVCACGIPNQANYHTHVILSRPHPCGVGTETTYTDIYTCTEHTYGETDTRKMLQWDGHEAWEIVEVSQTELR